MSLRPRKRHDLVLEPDQLIKRDRKAPDPHAGSVPNRVGDGAGGAGDADLADALDAERIDVEVVFLDQDRLDRGTSAFTGTWYSARFAFIVRPVRRSITACSCSANDTPQIMPPRYWLRTMRGLMIRPGGERADQPGHADLAEIGIDLDLGEHRAVRVHGIVRLRRGIGRALAAAPRPPPRPARPRMSA